MKVISPWFGTARLINGIRKAYSEMQAGRSDAGPRDRETRPLRDILRQTAGRKPGMAE